MSSKPAAVPADGIVVQKRIEEALRKEMRADAMKKCDRFVGDFVECSKARTVSMLWACKEQKNAMFDCIREWSTPERFTEYKREFMRKNPDVDIATGHYISEEAAAAGRARIQTEKEAARARAAAAAAAAATPAPVK